MTTTSKSPRVAPAAPARTEAAKAAARRQRSSRPVRQRSCLPAAHGHARNPGVPYDSSWFDDIRVNLSAAERRIATLPGRRSVKKDAQAGWLLKAISCIDLTTLSGDDTTERVKRLCAKAITPVRQDLLDALGFGDRQLHTGAICVYHRYVATAVEALDGSGIPVAAVSTGFPGRPDPARSEAEGNRSVGARWRLRDRYRHHPRTRADR